MNTKYISDEFTDLNCLQTKGISISLIPKHATTNLVRFFIGTGANGKNNDSKYSRLFKNTAYDISQHKPLIVVTRNETERWSSGVVQELNEYDEFFETEEISKDNPMEMLTFLNKKMETNLSDFTDKNMESVLFWGKGSHSQLVPLWVHWMPVLMQMNNVYFTDLSCLKTLSFWQKVCLMDSSFPPVLEWFDDWMNMYMREGNNNNRLEIYNEKKIANMVKESILTRRSFEFISDILDNNQKILDYLKTTDRWLS